ncbi:hypothetical protein GCK32_007695 [Trichostrongylus colubriformis]|uniref:Peptidase A2 domain-containing protein n=1 Tax=Trichostrongylus colubriformis TaxID=6319 RepID=A0AAN8F3A7_TRICO
MFKQLIEEQRNLASSMMKEQRDIIAMIMDRAPQRDERAVKLEEQVTLPSLMAALSNRIEKFIFDLDADMSFSNALEANCPRVYVNVLVNNYQVRFLLDTGSDITLLNEKTWKKMGSPALERTNIVVKNASGEYMKIHGMLKCKIKMKGVETDGYANVMPYNSLIGLEWIRANEDMKDHLKMMTAEVKWHPSP